MDATVIHIDDVEPVSTPKGLTRFLVRHATGEGPNIMVRQWPPGTVLDRHAHPASEMFFILEGEVEVDGVVHGPGTCLFVPGGVEYGPLRVLDRAARLLRYYEAEPVDPAPTVPES